MQIKSPSREGLFYTQHSILFLLQLPIQVQPLLLVYGNAEQHTSMLSPDQE